MAGVKKKAGHHMAALSPVHPETWMAMIGPGLQPMGEVSEEQQLYQKQIAKMIAELVGEKFEQKIARR